MCPRRRLQGQGRPQGLHLCIISLEGAPNNLACALQFFYAYFVHVLRCSKQVFQIET